MFALVCLSILASTLAVPQYYHDYDYSSDFYDVIGDGVFDTGRFFNDFNKEMEQLDLAIQERMKHFSSQATSGLQGNQYKININLNGFKAKEITVNAWQGQVMVQGVHKTEDGGESNFLDVRTLPSFVKAETGSWTYDKGLLKIVFGVQETITTEASGTTEVTGATQAPDREEMESHENANRDQDAEIINNEISTNHEEAVEATTSAVNFKNEVELVPVKLNHVAQ